MIRTTMTTRSVEGDDVGSCAVDGRLVVLEKKVLGGEESVSMVPESDMKRMDGLDRHGYAAGGRDMIGNFDQFTSSIAFFGLGGSQR